jgi:hypothetical protein
MLEDTYGTSQIVTHARTMPLSSCIKCSKARYQLVVYKLLNYANICIGRVVPAKADTRNTRLSLCP